MMCYNMSMSRDLDEEPGVTEPASRSKDDLDWVIVERALTEGYDGRTSVADRIEIVRRGHALGWNDQEIARNTRTMTDRTVHRIRAVTLGLPPNYERVRRAESN